MESEKNIGKALHLVMQGHELLMALQQGMNEASNLLAVEEERAGHAIMAEALNKLRKEVEETQSAMRTLSLKWPTLTCAEVVMDGAISGVHIVAPAPVPSPANREWILENGISEHAKTVFEHGTAEVRVS